MKKILINMYIMQKDSSLQHVMKPYIHIVRAIVLLAASTSPPVAQPLGGNTDMVTRFDYANKTECIPERVSALSTQLMLWC